MEKIFDEVHSLDERCYKEFYLTEDILMEHAAFGIYQHIVTNFQHNSSILIVCGSGNNGADGIALARLLQSDFNVDLYLFKPPKTDMAIGQLQRAKRVGIVPIDTIQKSYEVVVDALFGSGLSRAIDQNCIDMIEQLNGMEGYKIACDIPSGIQNNGVVDTIAFKADITLTMGALKKSLFLDMAKDYVGVIEVVDLGVSRKIYETQTNCYLIDEDDLLLPYRDKKNTHKGDFGHLSIVSGKKEGAAILSAMGGFHLGAGLVSLVTHEKLTTEPYIMQSHFIPSNTTCICVGMGLGTYEKDEMIEILSNDIPKVIDADLFYREDILLCLDKDNVVLTPHPKEFCSLLKLCSIASIDINELQKHRFQYVKKFTQKYPNVVLLLKGANSIIAQNIYQYINPLGSSSLSFGGSGDVLAGFIGSLLAQGYTPLQSAIQGSLIHTLVSKRSLKNSYGLTPIDLIEGVAKL